MASTAAPSPPSLSPRPTQRPAAMAPASVTRTSSRARLRSGASPRAGLMGADSPIASPRVGGWDTGGDGWRVFTPAQRRRAGDSGPQTRKAPHPPGRPGHVLVDRAAGDRVHRAGGRARHVLVRAERARQGADAELRRAGGASGRRRRTEDSDPAAEAA